MMRMGRLVLAAALVLGGVLTGQAKEAAKTAGTAVKAEAVAVKPSTAEGIISNIDGKSITVGRGFYRLTGASVVTLNKGTVNFNALKVGDNVSIKFVSAATSDGGTGNDIISLAANRESPKVRLIATKADLLNAPKKNVTIAAGKTVTTTPNTDATACRMMGGSVSSPCTIGNETLYDCCTITSE